ncbi:Late expression factor 10 [Trabala vishnou gigantina nucleopolyhedrovirus]|uniref:Late expression factor 10 n=1 Tax=Trabala vishnou gigantina nucleopolyhedrovirus TaxID=2863583 RepID=UPI002481DFE3|nr:Late expression factor 10 [Trabala vishnou gigantina nucleopolyhedrovirus]QYC92786.1 Late expression factor 10 [Trabala vishnou gigantina nucleopolyhedrovirus]
MSSTASVDVDTADIIEDVFEKNHIKMLSYDEYYKLNRIKFIRIDANGKYHYFNKFLGIVYSSDEKINTLDDYKNYLILVY